MRAHESTFVIKGVTIAPLFIMSLVECSTSSSRHTERSLHAAMRQGKPLMKAKRDNISKVNQSFNNIIEQFQARDMSLGETIDDIFDCYSHCQDKNFVKYMTAKYDAVCDGSLEIDAHQFMAKALSYYNAKLTKGEWCNKSDGQSIIALSSEVDDLKTKLAQTATALSSQAKMKGSLRLAKKPSVGRKFKNKKTNSFKSVQRKDEEWKKKPPANGESESKVVRNKTFHWCIHHMCWTIHRPDDCLLGRERSGSQRSNFMANSATAARSQSGPRSPTTGHELNYLARVAEYSRDV